MLQVVPIMHSTSVWMSYFSLMIKDPFSHKQLVTLSDELFCLDFCYFHWFYTLHNFLDLNRRTISLTILSLDWASTQYWMVMHFGFNLFTNESGCQTIRVIHTCYALQLIWCHVPDVSYDSDWTSLWWLCWLQIIPDWIERNDSIACALHKIYSIFSKSPADCSCHYCLDWICLNGLITLLLINSW